MNWGQIHEWVYRGSLCRGACPRIYRTAGPLPRPGMSASVIPSPPFTAVSLDTPHHITLDGSTLPAR